ncbi:auxin-responsive protein SAUR76-like [Tasmannia lanceolata]|uniref:auxin-responsive protein SAUR76-like n=1 Tax=Tasmannia lanceolata TaxID=3420 RepID=UPI0040633CCC
MNCFVFTGRKSLRYHSLADVAFDSENTVTVVVGKEKRVFVVDPFVLEKDPFRILLQMMRKKNKGLNENIEERVIFINVDSILFEHMLWLMYNDCSSFLQLNLQDIVEFYAQDS